MDIARRGLVGSTDEPRSNLGVWAQQAFDVDQGTSETWLGRRCAARRVTTQFCAPSNVMRRGALTVVCMSSYPGWRGCAPRQLTSAWAAGSGPATAAAAACRGELRHAAAGSTRRCWRAQRAASVRGARRSKPEGAGLAAATGLPGRYDTNRAEGTKNKFGIRGYGRKGTRVYDFGWVPAAKGWGNGGMSVMRLQMHATDPDRLEPRLGTAQSKGCIRIPASLNELIDHYGVLDADYQEKIDDGRRLWVLRGDRTPTPWSGRYLVVVDSMSMRGPTGRLHRRRVEVEQQVFMRLTLIKHSRWSTFQNRSSSPVSNARSDCLPWISPHKLT